MHKKFFIIFRSLALLLSVSTFSPASFAQTSSTVSVLPTGFLISIHTQTESINYQWVAPATGTLFSPGSMLITDSINGASPQGQITLTSGIDWIGPAEVLQSVTYQGGTNITATLTYAGPSGLTHLTLNPFVDGNFAAVRFYADNATIQDIRWGQLPSTLLTTGISVPYYSQAVNYIGSLDLFENAYFDPFDSQASTLSTASGPLTFYALNENGTTTNVLQEIWKVSVSNNIVNVLPYPEHPASPYMAQLAGRTVLDIQSGTFATIAAQLANLGDYGINHCVAVIGDWQSLGYDNAYPTQYPANVSLGGAEAMSSIASAASANSCLFSLTENYTDYYQDYSGYTPAATMRNADGTQMLAWLNSATGVQAFATKPGFFIPNAQTQSPLIHQQYGTNATFIDVNSAATPWWRTDEDPSTYGSGRFAPYRDGSIALWSYERNVHGGPVFGEGGNHWFWSGLLDGVEAQFGAESTPITNGLQAPLFVDFDLTRIHPLQVNYGMGYYDRWTPGATTITTTLELDAYRMQEVIFGHNPYLSDLLWPSVPRALLEQNLVSPLATREALQTPSTISYMVNGSWSDASSAAKAGDFSLAAVSYASGDTVFANSGSSTVTWDSLQIPQYGWAAAGNRLLAYTAMLGGQIADYSQTPQSIYANARNQADILSENTLATPGVAAFQQIAPGVIQIQLGWDVNTPQPTTPYQEFIHFVSSQTAADPESLAGVTGGAPAVPTESWTTGQHIADNTLTFYLPATMPDGTYQVRVGLYNGPQRAILYGNDDGTQRYTVGSITVSNNQSSIVFQAIPISITNPDPRLNSTGSVVMFSTIRTDGMVLLQQQTANTLKISSYPRSRDVIVQVNASQVAMPASVACDNGDIVLPAMVGAYWQIDLRGRKYCTWNGTLP